MTAQSPRNDQKPFYYCYPEYCGIPHGGAIAGCRHVALAGRLALLLVDECDGAVKCYLSLF